MEDPPLFQADQSIRNADQEIAQFPAFLDQMRSWHEAEVTEIDLAREMAEWPSPYPELKLGDVYSTERLQTRATAYLACDPLTVEAAINGGLWFGCDPDAPIECPLTVVAADPSLNAMFRPEPLRHPPRRQRHRRQPSTGSVPRRLRLHPAPRVRMHHRSPVGLGRRDLRLPRHRPGLQRPLRRHQRQARRPQAYRLRIRQPPPLRPTSPPPNAPCGNITMTEHEGPVPPHRAEPELAMLSIRFVDVFDRVE